MDKNTRIVNGNGPQCKKCGEYTQIREHKQVVLRRSTKPNYYKRWFYCLNPNCKTTVIHDGKYKVTIKDKYPLFLSI